MFSGVTLLQNDGTKGVFITATNRKFFYNLRSILPSILSVRDLVHTMSSGSVQTLSSRILFLSLLEAFPPLPQDDLRKFSVLLLINKVDCSYYTVIIPYHTKTGLVCINGNHIT